MLHAAIGNRLRYTEFAGWKLWERKQMKAWLYYRLPRGGTGERNSLGNQRKILFNCAAGNGHTVVGESFGGVSGMHFNCAGIDKICDAAEAGGTETAAVKNFSRLRGRRPHHRRPRVDGRLLLQGHRQEDSGRTPAEAAGGPCDCPALRLSKGPQQLTRSGFTQRPQRRYKPSILCTCRTVDKGRSPTDSTR